MPAWHATGRPAWPPTHLGEWGVCVRSTVSNGEHLWPLGCGDRGQWWPRGSRRVLARAAKARHRLESQPCTHTHTYTHITHTDTHTHYGVEAHVHTPISARSKPGWCKLKPKTHTVGLFMARRRRPETSLWIICRKSNNRTKCACQQK